MRPIGYDTIARDHREAAELLPWYVNGTLEAAELESLTLHLDTCERCRGEFEAQRRLAHVLRTSEELAFSAPRAFEQLRARIDNEAEFERSKRENSANGPLERLRDGVLSLAVPVRWALVAQLVAIVALGTALVRGQGGQGEFQTLATPSALSTGEAPRLRVVFDAASSEGDIRTLLFESGARIVAGPSPFGVYTIETDAKSGEDVLDALRSSGLVAFAEPVTR